MSEAIGTRPAPNCLLCGAEGVPLYHGLRDRLFSAPGEWSHRQCAVPGCALLWLDPMPSEADIHKAYERYYTHAADRARDGIVDRLFLAVKRGYLANRFGYVQRVTLRERLLGLLPWVYPGRPAELDYSVMWLEPGTRGRLLDVGAGSGWLVAHMCTLGWQAEGLDFDVRAVAEARARGLSIRQGGLLEQGFPADSFDAVTMSHSIEHVHDPVGWLREVRRILRPGGRLALATPNSRSLLHRCFGEHWFPLDPPRHLYLFNRDAMSRALRQAGFDRFRQFTSIREANGAYFLGSRSIRSHGRYDMTAAHPAILKVWGRAFQLVEGAYRLVDDDAGEDLVALAAKPG